MKKKLDQKKILLFTRPLVPPWDEGSKNLAFQIALHSQGDFCFHLLTDQSGLLEKELPFEKKLCLKTEPLFFSGRLDWKNKTQLMKRIFQPNLKADLIHFLFTPRLVTSRIFRWRLKNKPVKTIQTIATLNDEWVDKPQLAKKILFADLVVAQSRHTLQRLEKLGLNARLIYPGIDLKKFIPTGQDENLGKELGIHPNDFVLLFTGEYDRLEATDDILEAFYLLEKQKQTEKLKIILACRLKTARDRKIKQTVQTEIARRGWKKNFVFLDFAEDMVKLYNLADLNIFPVRKMAGKFDIPLVLIESMACGKPVLVSDLPVLRELIQDDSNGVVVPAANPEKLAEKILWLKNNPETNQKLGQAGRQTAQQLFDIEETSKRYEEVYQQILK